MILCLRVIIVAIVLVVAAVMSWYLSFAPFDDADGNWP